MTGPAKACTVYFDGSCPLCRREISYYRAQGGAQAIAFVDLSAFGGDLGPGLDRERSLARFHVRDGDGALLSGAEAFVALWRALPRFGRLARLADMPGMMAVLEAAYRGFLVVRPSLQRLARRWQRTPVS